MGEMSLDLLDNDRAFEQAVINEIRKYFVQVAPKIINGFEKKIKEVITNSVYDCTELNELRTGTLRGELGLTQSMASKASKDIADAVGGSTIVEFSTGKRKEIGSITIKVQPSDFANVFSQTESSFISFSRSSGSVKKAEIAWLDWLLFKGDAIIVADYKFVKYSGKGRSGMGRMKKDPTGWRVDPAFSGTRNDNFITRALSHEKTQKEFSEIIQESMKKHWN
jgi:hypothetical protein